MEAVEAAFRAGLGADFDKFFDPRVGLRDFRSWWEAGGAAQFGPEEVGDPAFMADYLFGFSEKAMKARQENVLLLHKVAAASMAKRAEAEAASTSKKAPAAEKAAAAKPAKKAKGGKGSKR